MRLLAIIGLLAICNGVLAERRWTEPIPYGNMDEWQVRYIQESKLLGGKTKTLYALQAYFSPENISQEPALNPA